jgi:hypothetical protein
LTVEIHIIVGTSAGIELDKYFIVGVAVISNAAQDSLIAHNIVRGGVVQGNSFVAIPSELPAFGGVEAHFRTVKGAIRVPQLQGEMYSSALVN